MDLNEKIEQRRREREQIEVANRAQIAAQMAINEELAKKEARRRLEQAKQEARRQLEEEGLNIEVDKLSVDKEKEKIIEKMANERWKSSENWVLALFLIGSAAAFFVNWLIGMIGIVISIYYSGKITDKYKAEIKNEMKVKSKDGRTEFV
jgi:Flp pilus assembly protein TadB